MQLPGAKIVLASSAVCCREELQQPVFMAIDALEYPELHDESIPTLAFIKSLNQLLVAAGIKDFNLQVHTALPYKL